MPIYAYRCTHCGHAQDVLRKVSDPALSVCPACGQPTYVKQVTAAGFQLKGSGWYVTDFRGDKKAGKAAESGDADTGAASEAEKGAEKGGEKVAEKGGEKGGDAPSGGAEARSEAKNGDSGKKSDAAPAPAAAPSPAPAASPAAPATPGKAGS